MSRIVVYGLGSLIFLTGRSQRACLLGLSRTPSSYRWASRICTTTTDYLTPRCFSQSLSACSFGAAFEKYFPPGRRRPAQVTEAAAPQAAIRRRRWYCSPVSASSQWTDRGSSYSSYLAACMLRTHSLIPTPVTQDERPTQHTHSQLCRESTTTKHMAALAWREEPRRLRRAAVDASTRRMSVSTQPDNIGLLCIASDLAAYTKLASPLACDALHIEEDGTIRLQDGCAAAATMDQRE